MREINDLLQKIRNKIQNPREELPEEIFLFATEITPMVNVDLLIYDNDGRILLSWRDDKFYDKGWHVPGGILRLQETFEQRIQRTALDEIGCMVEHSGEPIEIVPIICKDMVQRSHFISFVYKCKLAEGYEIDNGEKKENEAGYLKWFEKCPDNLLDVHSFYKKYFKEI